MSIDASVTVWSRPFDTVDIHGFKDGAVALLLGASGLSVVFDDHDAARAALTGWLELLDTLDKTEAAE